MNPSLSIPTRRGRIMAAKLPELSIHIAVISHLRVRLVDGWDFNHPAGGELREKRVAAKLRAMGLQAGRPDIELHDPHGVYHGLELKTEGGRLNEAQKDWRAFCVRHGRFYAVADSIDAALAQLEEWGAIRPDVGGRA